MMMVAPTMTAAAITMIKPQTKQPMRHELKHQISPLEDLVLSSNCRKVFTHDNHAKNGTYQVNSLYFDTFDDQAYQDKIAGVNVREKFRIRYYDDDLSFIRLEKKFKRNGLCGKISTRLSFGQTKDILDSHYDWMVETNDPLLLEFYAKIKGQGLHPVTVVVYQREPFIYPYDNVRITFDRHISTTPSIQSFLSIGCTIPVLVETTVLEVKYDRYLADIVRQMVNLNDRRHGATSKYTLSRYFE